MNAFRFIAGQRFGKLVLLERISKQQWRCTCDCGGEVNAWTASLRRGQRWHCGCQDCGGHAPPRDWTVPDGRRWGRIVQGTGWRVAFLPPHHEPPALIEARAAVAGKHCLILRMPDGTRLHAYEREVRIVLPHGKAA